MKLLKHFLTITKHRHMVRHFMLKCGLFFQGTLHDLSKYSFTEFFTSVKYYTGKRSPINQERLEHGYSKVWLHHKGRNKHHFEYWIDMDPVTRIYKPVKMPNRYIAESFCDHLSASLVYNGKNFKKEDLQNYYFLKEKDIIPMHSKTKEIFEKLLEIYMTKGEEETFKYIKNNLRGKE